ncbi:MAG: patatin-like phospholipase family protein, partial [Polyangiaceae bacterium]
MGQLASLRQRVVRVPITIVLQGGGARGAWQAGVLAELVDADVCDVAGVFGTSAGAINAAALSVAAQAGSDALLDVWTRLAGSAKGQLGRALLSVPLTYLRLREAGSSRRTPLFSSKRLREALAAAFPGPWSSSSYTYVFATKLPHAPVAARRLPPFAFQADPGHARFQPFARGLQGFELVDVLTASACLPMVSPIELGGVQFADGGVIANVPASFLTTSGALAPWGFTLMVLPTSPTAMSASSEYVDWKTLELLHEIRPAVVRRTSHVFVVTPRRALGGGLSGLLGGLMSEDSTRDLFRRGREDAAPFLDSVKA